MYIFIEKNHCRRHILESIEWTEGFTEDFLIVAVCGESLIAFDDAKTQTEAKDYIHYLNGGNDSKVEQALYEIQKTLSSR